MSWILTSSYESLRRNTILWLAVANGVEVNPKEAAPPLPVKQILLIQFPPEMDENWVRYGLAKLGQISRTKLAEDAVLCVHNTASALNR